MKLSALWISLAFIPAMNADVICTTNVVSIPVFDPSSTSGAVGDLELDCTGGTPVPAGKPAPLINVSLDINALILNSTWTLADTTNSTSTTGTRASGNVIDFLGVPFAPDSSGDIGFEFQNILVNPSAEPPGFEFDGLVAITSNFAITVPIVPQEVAVNGIPEPFSFWLLGLGLGGMLWTRRPRFRSPHRTGI